MADNICMTKDVDLKTNNDSENSVKDPAKALLDLPKAVRIDLAHQAWKDANGQLSIKKAASIYNISFSTLHGRIHGAVPKAQASQAMQRLTVAEEEAIRDQLLDLSSLGVPLKPGRLRALAIDLLRKRGDRVDLGVRWTDQYLSRYPELKAKFVGASAGTVEGWMKRSNSRGLGRQKERKEAD